MLAVWPRDGLMGFKLAAFKFVEVATFSHYLWLLSRHTVVIYSDVANPNLYSRHRKHFWYVLAWNKRLLIWRKEAT